MKAVEATKTQQLSLPEELLLMLLNRETGYFFNVPGWELNCAIVGAIIAELSLLSRVDTDMNSLYLLDKNPTHDPVLDRVLEDIASEPGVRSPVYWIERLSVHAESVIDSTLQKLSRLKILEHHDGEFWTLASDSQHSHNIRARIAEYIFSDAIPEPRDAIIISLVETCDVFRFIFEIDEDTETRIKFICKLDLIGYSIGNAVEQNIASPLLRRPSLTRKIPVVELRKILFNQHFRNGYIPALLADMTKEYGPVFTVRSPFKDDMTFMAGPEVNHFIHRNGRMHLRSKDYFTDFEKVYGASGLIPALDGADHFRMRKTMRPIYSRKTFGAQLDEIFSHIRNCIGSWHVGSTVPVAEMTRLLVNAVISPIVLGIDAQDIVVDLIKYKERAITIHVAKLLPNFLLKTSGMIQAYKAIETAVERVQTTHTPAQRVGCPRDLADDLLSLHSSDPQFMPESNLGFSLSAPMLASMYLGDALGFALYSMVSQPELYRQVVREADALFANGDPKDDDFNESTIDITRRLVMESLRIYPVIPASIRNVMNSFVVEGYELPVGEKVYIATTASHYLDHVFPDPFTFDIDRYLPPRNEHRSAGYAPFGLGTHKCLGFDVAEFLLAVNLLMIGYYFTLEFSPKNYKIGFNPIPSMSPNKKMKVRVVEHRNELVIPGHC